MDECIDTDKDHKCDLCQKILDECADTDKDHKCDLCQKILSECADTDKDHKCDLCQKILSECADTDKDHKCDLCQKILSQCVDTDKDGICDVCGKTIGDCIDADNDHKCDRCGKILSEHIGGKADCHTKAVCDICGENYGEYDGNNHTGDTELREAKNATCIEEGYTGDIYCKGCDAKLEGGTVLPAFGHQGGTATCTDNPVCELCGENYGEKDPANHTGIKEWIPKNETEHERKYSCCGELTKEKESHKWKNGVCTDCNYGCEHSGGTADCHTKAVCDICGESYGKFDKNNHIGGTKRRDVKNATCTEDGYAGDTYCKGCGVKLKKGKVLQAAGHKGGIATCTTRAVCKVCGESYGALNNKNHFDMKHFEPVAATKDAEGNSEYWYCSGCNKYFADAAGNEEITKANTITSRLPDESKSPKTEDTSNIWMWLALFFISGGVVIKTVVISRKKKCIKK